MSLGAKELFHSNVLAMFLCMKNSSGKEAVFPSLKALFPPNQTNQDEYEILDVRREKNNFDLLVIYLSKEDFKKLPENFSAENYYKDSSDKIDGKCEDAKNANEVLKNVKYAVIENKFKSIPNENQLEEYSQKARGNGVQIFSSSAIPKLSVKNTAFYIFAPEESLKSFFEKETKDGWKNDFSGAEWEGRSYEEYVSELHSSKIKDCFVSCLVEKYCSFVSTMLDIYKNDVLKRLNEDKAFLSEEQENLFKTRRIQDFFEKLCYSRLLLRLKKDLGFERYNKNKPANLLRFRTAVMYTRQQGGIELYFDWKNFCSTFLELQGGDLRICVMSWRKFPDLSEEKLEFAELAELNEGKNENPDFDSLKEENKNNSKKVNKKAKEIIIKMSGDEAELNFKSKGKQPYGYTTDDYISRYARIPIAKGGNWRDFSYEKLKDKIKDCLERIKSAGMQDFSVN